MVRVARWGPGGRPRFSVGPAGSPTASREGTPPRSHARSHCASLGTAACSSLVLACRDVTLSILAPPPPPDKHPLSVEGTAQGFLRGHWLLNERPD